MLDLETAPKLRRINNYSPSLGMDYQTEVWIHPRAAGNLAKEDAQSSHPTIKKGQVPQKRARKRGRKR